MTASEPGAESANRELRRIAPVAAIIAIFLLIINAFVCATWACFTGMGGWLFWQIIPGSLPVAFIVTTLLGFRFSNPLLRLIYTASAAWLGAFNYLFFAAIICWIVGGISWLAAWPLSPAYIAEASYGFAAVVATYGLINAAVIRTTHIDVALPHLPESWNGHTVALVTDLHLGHLSRPTFLPSPSAAPDRYPRPRPSRHRENSAALPGAPGRSRHSRQSPSAAASWTSW